MGGGGGGGAAFRRPGREMNHSLRTDAGVRRLPEVRGCSPQRGLRAAGRGAEPPISLPLHGLPFAHEFISSQHGLVALSSGVASAGALEESAGPWGAPRVRWEVAGSALPAARHRAQLS